MTDPTHDDLEALLDAARADRPARADDERLERRVLGSIAAGAVATAVPASKAAAILRFLGGNPLVSLALLAVGAATAVWITTHDVRAFLAAPQQTPAGPALSAPPPVPADVTVPAISPAAPDLQPVRPAAPPAIQPIGPRNDRAVGPAARAHAGSPAHESAPPSAQDVEVRTDVRAGVAANEPERGTTAEVPAQRASSEVALLAQARAALRRSDTGGALAAIAEHDARYPSGQFAEELDVLRVEALAGAGRAADARSRAAQFGRQWPGSTYAERVRRAVGQAGAP